MGMEQVLHYQLQQYILLCYYFFAISAAVSGGIEPLLLTPSVSKIITLEIAFVIF